MRHAGKSTLAFWRMASSIIWTVSDIGSMTLLLPGLRSLHVAILAHGLDCFCPDFFLHHSCIGKSEQTELAVHPVIAKSLMPTECFPIGIDFDYIPLLMPVMRIRDLGYDPSLVSVTFGFTYSRCVIWYNKSTKMH